MACNLACSWAGPIACPRDGTSECERAIENDIINAGIQELRRAEEKHPVFPEDLIHKLAIMAEESGEAMQAALNYYYHGGDYSQIKVELVQTMAMCMRCLKNME
ncbi:MAG: hypothetical protein GY816_23335 [Cytophagales bacterium]|nr:hypothetical protein [Cytophagales bacterium]